MQPILRQAEQYPNEVERCKVAWGDRKQAPTPPKKPDTSPPAVRNDDVFVMPGSESGLYGEDETHPYDAIVTPSGHGPKSYDVLKSFPEPHHLGVPEGFDSPRLDPDTGHMH